MYFKDTALTNLKRSGTNLNKLIIPETKKVLTKSITTIFNRSEVIIFWSS